MVFLSEGKTMSYVCITNTKTILNVGLHLQGSLSSWMNLTFIPRKLTGLRMYQESQELQVKDERLWACGPEERGELLGRATLACVHMGHAGKSLDACDPQ